MSKNGFTLVEAIIVIVVIVAILAILIPVLRERERQQLQAMADAEPWEIFGFRAEPNKVSFGVIDVQCEIVNPTDYPLTLPKGLINFHLFFVDTNYIAGASRWEYPILRTAIAPGESASFEVLFPVSGTGTAEFRIVYDKGITQRVSGRGTLPPVFSPFEFLEARDILPSAEKRFQSNAFQLVVEEGDKSRWPTFDEILAFTAVSEPGPPMILAR